MNAAEIVRSRAVRAIRKSLPWLALPAIAFLLVRFVLLAPVKVETVTLAERDLAARAYGNGTVEARVVAAVSSKGVGRIRELYADQGDAVRAGQLLAVLEDDDVSHQALQAEAGVKRAAALLATEEAGLRKARASLELAERNEGRFRELADKGFVPRLDAEQQETAARLAAEEVGRCTAAVEAARLEQAASAAGAGFAASRRRDMSIHAPGDGIVISRDMERGDTVSPGLPIFRIADPGRVWVRANVDESQLAGVSVGKEATIALRSAPGTRLRGKVARVGRESDRVTEELAVEVAFETPPGDFRLGEQAEVLIVTDTRKRAASLPAAALAARGKERGVWALRDGRLEFRKVVVGIEDRDGFVEVLSGIGPETAVALPVPGKASKFRDGLRVSTSR
jgi:HlyD family secretion protein